jgi:hypothetical protein
VLKAPRWLVLRIAHVRLLFWRPLTAVIGSLWGLWGGLSTARAEIKSLPPRLQDTRVLDWFKVSWQEWVTGALLILLGVAVEGSYRLHVPIVAAEREQEVRNKLARLRAHGIKLLNDEWNASPAVSQADEASWRGRLFAEIRSHFPEQTLLRIDNLGVFNVRGLRARNQQFVENLAERLQILDEVIAGRHGAIMR